MFASLDHYRAEDVPCRNVGAARAYASMKCYAGNREPSCGESRACDTASDKSRSYARCAACERRGGSGSRAARAALPVSAGSGSAAKLLDKNNYALGLDNPTGNLSNCSNKESRRSHDSCTGTSNIKDRRTARAPSPDQWKPAAGPVEMETLRDD